MVTGTNPSIKGEEKNEDFHRPLVSVQFLVLDRL
jgi:hypothetical protein